MANWTEQWRAAHTGALSSLAKAQALGAGITALGTGSRNIKLTKLCDKINKRGALKLCIFQVNYTKKESKVGQNFGAQFWVVSPSFEEFYQISWISEILNLVVVSQFGAAQDGV